jgi:hypothetical protein
MKKIETKLETIITPFDVIYSIYIQEFGQEIMMPLNCHGTLHLVIDGYNKLPAEDTK